MAKFLTTSGTSYHLEQLIISAKTELVLLTPYLQLSPNFLSRLRDADQRGIHNILIYGKNRLNNKEWYQINELRNIDIFFCENLHAKCYQNEESLIISSMNLYQFSQENNREMSILITKESDNEAYEKACKEIQSIINSSIIDKSSGRMEGDENEKVEKVSTDPDFSEMQNFHIPQLHNLLKQTYPDVSFSIEEGSLSATDQIKAKDFPVEGIDLEIDDRILFHFDEQHQSTIWYDKKSQFYDDIPEAKIYVESNRLKLYWRERNNTIVSEQNLPIKANAYFDIVNKVVNILN